MNKVIEMKQIMELFFITVLAAGISFGNAFAHDPVSRNKINTSLNLPQVFECENLAKKIVKKLRAQGLTDKQIIDAFADEIATNVDGEHDGKSFFTSKLALIVGGVTAVGVVSLIAYKLYKQYKQSNNKRINNNSLNRQRLSRQQENEQQQASSAQMDPVDDNIAGGNSLNLQDEQLIVSPVGHLNSSDSDRVHNEVDELQQNSLAQIDPVDNNVQDGNEQLLPCNNSAHYSMRFMCHTPTSSEVAALAQLARDCENAIIVNSSESEVLELMDSFREDYPQGRVWVECNYFIRFAPDHWGRTSSSFGI